MANALRAMIAQQAHLDPTMITPDSLLSELGVTSLDLVEIIMMIEDKYNVSIPMDAAEAWSSYKTVANLIELGRSIGLDERSGEI